MTRCVSYPSSLLLMTLFTTLALLSAPTRAATDEEVSVLQSKLIALEARLERLEAERAASEAKARAAAAQPVAAAVTAAAAEPAKAPPADPAAWAQRIAVKGDFRVREDHLHTQGVNAQDRSRIRARIGIAGKVNDTTSVMVSLATGGSDPISRNQTLGDGLSTKGINLEQAYVLWKPAAVKGLEVSAGKFKQTFRNTGDASLIWDADLNPEGVAVNYVRDTSFGQWFGSANTWWVEEHPTSAETVMLGAQTGLIFKFGTSGTQLTTGAGYYGYRSVAGRTPFFDGKARGNTLRAGKYDTGFRDTELFAELKGKIGSVATSAYTDWVRNSEARKNDTGFVIGANAAMNGVTLGYAWKRLDADAVLATFADSDFGSGGTDVRGHIFTVAADLAQNTAFKLSWFKVETGRNAGNTKDVNRVQADLNFKF